MNLARQAYRTNVLPDSPKRYPETLLSKKTAILEAVKGGNYITVAAALGGISTSSLQLWLRRGQAALEAIEAEQEVHPYDLEYAKFVQEFQEAQAQAEAVLVSRVMAHTENQWVAAMTMLERRFPERWRRRETTEHVIPDGPAEDEDKVDLGSTDRLKEVVAILTKHRLLPEQLAPGVIEGAAEVVEAAAESVHPAQSDGEATGGPSTPTP